MSTFVIIDNRLINVDNVLWAERGSCDDYDPNKTQLFFGPDLFIVVNVPPAAVLKILQGAGAVRA